MSEPLSAAVVVAHEKYVSHIMFCRDCFAPTKRHCLTGLALRIEYDAHYLMSITDVRCRRSLLQGEMLKNPANADGLKARVIELFNEKEAEAQKVVIFS